MKAHTYKVEIDGFPLMTVEADTLKELAEAITGTPEVRPKFPRVLWQGLFNGIGVRIVQKAEKDKDFHIEQAHSLPDAMGNTVWQNALIRHELILAQAFKETLDKINGWP